MMMMMVMMMMMMVVVVVVVMMMMMMTMMLMMVMMIIMIERMQTKCQARVGPRGLNENEMGNGGHRKRFVCIMPPVTH